MATRPSWNGLHGYQNFREVSLSFLSPFRFSGKTVPQLDESCPRLRPALGGNSTGQRPEKQRLWSEWPLLRSPLGSFRVCSVPLDSPRLFSVGSVPRLSMSDVLAAAVGTRFEPSAAGGLGSVDEDSCLRGGAGTTEKRCLSPPLLPPSENEDSAQRSESTFQAPVTSENDALQCRLQNGSPVNAEATKDSGTADDSLEEQDVEGKEEILTDQHQKEEAVVLMTKYRVPQGPGDIVMIQSEYTGAVDVLSAELETTDLLARPPPLIPPTTWTSAKIREFKTKMAKEKNAQMVVKRGEVLTVRVPTHPDGKRVCWEFATEDYDIGFGVYFDWTPVTSTAITVQVSESSDEEDEEEEFEGPIPVGDVERGSKSYLRNRYGEIMPVYRRDSHRDVQVGSHDYPGEGIYLLKFDNSYSLLRNKILFFHVYYAS
ncbi:protein TMED8 isoform X2 [Rhineura floridana]|uniref:protein TMED8 isoform X2 n=1 Tax=Rhineura floridana TaxID=261503 RepID=UPI002AC7ED2E|nr:protein TMED8 isoform X2 [Rhineura floridana]